MQPRRTYSEGLYCAKHKLGNSEFASTGTVPCPLCQLEIELASVFNTTTPRYRYWRIKRKKGQSERTFEYTTELADRGKYWAIERRWIKVKNGERGKIIRKVGFRTRTKAKERAHAWFQKASTPANPIAV